MVEEYLEVWRALPLLVLLKKHVGGVGRDVLVKAQFYPTEKRVIVAKVGFKESVVALSLRGGNQAVDKLGGCRITEQLFLMLGLGEYTL